MAISAKELAEMTGVSPATVSMVMNNRPGISQATRELVLKAAAQYGYNTRKSSDNTAPASVIQLITYKKHGQVVANTPFFSELTEGITRECGRQNCSLHVSYIHEKPDIQKQIAQLKEIECAGILLLATEMHEQDFKWFEGFHVPIVILDAYYDGLDYDCVQINNIQGAFHATSYLLDCGHKNVGYLHSSMAISNFDERADGFYKALRTYGLSSSQACVHRIAPTSQQGYTDMLNILASGTRPADAYFADNDIIAAAAIKAFMEYGYRLPGDISIIGFDNMPLCDMMTPALTTMNVKKKEMGATAIRRLLDRIQDPSLEHLKLSIATKLVIRDSVFDKR